jgi:hypothetical protein
MKSYFKRSLTQIRCFMCIVLPYVRVTELPLASNRELSWKCKHVIPSLMCKAFMQNDRRVSLSRRAANQLVHVSFASLQQQQLLQLSITFDGRCSKNESHAIWSKLGPLPISGTIGASMVSRVVSSCSLFVHPVRSRAPSTTDKVPLRR